MKTELGPTFCLLYWQYIWRNDCLNLLSCSERSTLTLLHNLPMNNHSLSMLLPPATVTSLQHFSQVYISSLRTLGSIEVTLKDALLIIFLPQCKLKKNQTKPKKRQNRKEKERLIWEFRHLVFGFRCRALVIF